MLSLPPLEPYWMAVVNNKPMIPRRPLSILQNREETADKDGESGNDPYISESDVQAEDTCPNLELASANTGLQAQSEHFHQVFITKNYVLCAQMKKRFYDLAAGRDLAKDHMQYEDAEVPTTLCDVEDHAYPLFLTARQFFLLLDNSLNDGKTFFKRDEKGQLLEKIVSSDYDNENPDIFLVWMEIKSFIKGSRKAVLKEEGHLTREEYEDLGKKIAPNYDGKREDIYEIFELYKKYIHHHTEENVFDESDLNHNIHSRLNAMKDLT